MRKNFLLSLALACSMTLAGSLLAMANTPEVTTHSRPTAHAAALPASAASVAAVYSAAGTSVPDISSFSSASSTVPSANSSSAPASSSAASQTSAVTTNSESDYFSSALFIGDSRTQGLMTCSDLSDATFYAAKGLTVSSIFTKQAVKTNNGYITIIDALKLHKFKEVYIMLGINELGWQYSDIFIEKYGQVIDAIRSSQPTAKIVVQPIFPVTEGRSESDAIFNNKRIREYNQLIQNMAAEKKVVYLDVSPALTDSSGSLCANGSVDGIHLTYAYCQKWCNFLKKNIS